MPLVAWRVRNVGEARSRVVMENLPVCANCHSFSADGKTMGMDLDGLQGNRGHVHPGAGRARDGDPQAGRDSVEFAAKAS